MSLLAPWQRGKPGSSPTVLAAFIVSDRNSYMTGEVIVQDGGVVV